MIITRMRRRVVAAVLSLGAVLATTAATTPATPHAAAAPARAAAPACPQFEDKLKAAADRDVDLGRITPTPAWRTTCGTLYRSDSRSPDKVFPVGFLPKDVAGGQYDIEKYVLVNQPSPSPAASPSSTSSGSARSTRSRRSRSWTTAGATRTTSPGTDGRGAGPRARSLSLHSLEGPDSRT